MLHQYLDGELDNPATDRVAAHLDMCSHCGLEASTYHAIKESVARGQRPAPAALERLRDFAAGVVTNPGGDAGRTG